MVSSVCIILLIQRRMWWINPPIVFFNPIGCSNGFSTSAPRGLPVPQMKTYEVLRGEGVAEQI